jgi:asparagine synthase (glutamine-hydrolysing)
MPWELPKVLEPGFAHQGWQELQTLNQLNATIAGLQSPHMIVSALESAWYMRNQLLRDADWASMAHGLELRVPLVDHRLLATLAPLYAAGQGPGKSALAHTPAQPLPDAILQRPKTGFSIPVRQWLNGNPAQEQAPNYRGWAKAIYRAFTDKA